jgi:hypothetical protein
MADDEPKLSGGRADDEPKLSGGRADDEPKLSGGRGGNGGGTFGGGGGWVVVAFISPVSTDVPAMAARILRGESANSPTSPQRRALGKAGALAQKDAVKRERVARAQQAEQQKLRVENRDLVKQYVMAPKKPKPPRE